MGRMNSNWISLRMGRRPTLGVALPAGLQQCELTLSSLMDGVQILNDVNSQNNKTTKGRSGLIAGRRIAVWASIRPDGEAVSVDVSLDGDHRISWAGKQASPTLRGLWRPLLSTQLGLGTWQGDVAFHHVRLPTPLEG